MVREFEVTRKRVYEAATQGDVATFQQLLQKDPYLLDVVSFACSRNALHIATMCGQLGIVEEALRVNPRLARSLDSQKSSALHIAAEEENVGIAAKLLSTAPAMCWLRLPRTLTPFFDEEVLFSIDLLEKPNEDGVSILFYLQKISDPQMNERIFWNGLVAAVKKISKKTQNWRKKCVYGHHIEAKH